MMLIAVMGVSKLRLIADVPLFYVRVNFVLLSHAADRA